jgi:hypothetical protein
MADREGIHVFVSYAVGESEWKAAASRFVQALRDLHGAADPLRALQGAAEPRGGEVTVTSATQLAHAHGWGGQVFAPSSSTARATVGGRLRARGGLLAGAEQLDHQGDRAGARATVGAQSGLLAGADERGRGGGQGPQKAEGNRGVSAGTSASTSSGSWTNRLSASTVMAAGGWPSSHQTTTRGLPMGPQRSAG